MKIALIGYGKMGRMIEKIALDRGHEIVCKIDVDNQSDFGSAEFASADVAIEFTTPKTAVGNIERSFAAGVPVVCGTTGWLEQMDHIKDLCEQTKGALFYASNYSLGVNIFMAVNSYLAKIMNGFKQYDPTINEVHHIHKLDHPSGTAITLAEGIMSQLERKNAWTEEADAEGLLITHQREGEVPGIHTITWDSAEDTISMRHEAKGREGLALGAVAAAEWLAGRRGFYTMADMLKF
ncbi:MAG: 4-hydroxy-tetrahydrodipicolinate reductase [Muribaculaceae bacterium]|jgi:4-hydroxy-tetrahydrodipicolinate reductase|nr:4-hydroxy-tetrahydrodipicolinate reductase [Muribaculaceae bacterium]